MAKFHFPWVMIVVVLLGMFLVGGTPRSQAASQPVVVRGFVSTADFPAKPGYFRDARRWGADVLRLQLYPGHYAREHHEKFQQAMPSFLNVLASEVRRAHRAGLKLILALFNAPYSNVSQHEAHTKAYWQRTGLAPRLGYFWKAVVRRIAPFRSTIWGYDIYNEPFVSTKVKYNPVLPPQWPSIAIKTIIAIRKIDKKSWIVYQGTSYAGDSGFTNLKPLPEPRVIYEVHFYDPSSFTFQGLLPGFKRPVYFPGHKPGQWTKKNMVQALQPVVNFQNRYHVPIYIGEFSVIRWAPRKSAVAWLRDAISIFESHHWSWTYHAFGEFNGWSLKYGSHYWKAGMPAPVRARHETARAKVVRAALKRNWNN